MKILHATKGSSGLRRGFVYCFFGRWMRTFGLVVKASCSELGEIDLNTARY